MALVTTLATFSVGMTLAVSVAGSASAASPKGTTTTMTTTTKASPGDRFFVINGTVSAASDHEIVGSSAFPNFAKGAVDNYYSLAYSHVDNSPFAQGTASPADTGPVGQTAAAGNFQQPQYADARWPGDSGTATYGSPGSPYATAEAGEYRATADASQPSNGLSGPGLDGSRTLPVPVGFDGRLRQALATWKATWQDRLSPKKSTPAVTTPIATVTVPKAAKPGITPPAATVTTPVATVATPTPPAAAGGVNPTPPVTVPLPSPGARHPGRSLAALSTPQSPAAASSSPDGETLLTSSTRATLVPKPDATKAVKTKTKKKGKSYTLVTSGESSLGRVTLGGGQIVIEGIHVTASIANDGTPTYKAAVSVAAASIGGVPVTIDKDGVHVVDQGQGLPYEQASDALNGALKQAGIRLFLVAPEVTKNSCGDQLGAGTGSGTSSPSSSSSGDQSGTTSSCDQAGAACDPKGTGTGGLPGIPTPPTASDQPGTPGSCDQPGAMCDQNAAGTGGGTGGVPGIGTTTTTTTTTTTSRSQSGTTTTPSSCDQFGAAPTTGLCQPTGAAKGTTTTSNDQTDTTTTSAGDQLGLGTGDTSSGALTVTATGVHVVFTQPVNAPGVPAQFVEHILGEVFVDSLAVPAGPLPSLGFGSASSSASSSCGGGTSRGTASGASTAGGSASSGGSTSSGSPSGAAFGSASQPTAGSTGTSLPASFATALRKPLWLLLAYVVWQLLVIGTGWSLWNWRRDGAS